MEEDILATVLRPDETEALIVTNCFDGALCHAAVLQYSFTTVPTAATTMPEYNALPHLSIGNRTSWRLSKELTGIWPRNSGFRDRSVPKQVQKPVVATTDAWITTAIALIRTPMVAHLTASALANWNTTPVLTIYPAERDHCAQ